MSYENEELKKLKEAKNKIKIWEQEQQKKETDGEIRLSFWEQKQQRELVKQGHDAKWEPKTR